MNYDIVTLSRGDYDRLKETERKYIQSEKERRENATREIVKNGLCKVIFTDDKYFANIMGADFETGNLDQFVKWEDMLEKARVHEKHKAEIESIQIVYEKDAEIKKLRTITKGLVIGLGFSLGALILLLVKMIIW